MTQNALFGRESKALLTALGGQRPPLEDYRKHVSWREGDTGSANHKWRSNLVAVLVALLDGDAETVAKFRKWQRWYAWHAPLHENEAMTPNVAYRRAILDGGWIGALLAKELGEHDVAGRMLERCRADVAYLVLGLATGGARKITDHHLEELGRAFLWKGDGPLRWPLEGVNYVAQAGLRGLVRAGGHANHTGEIEDELHQALAEVVAFATNVGKVPAYARELFDAVRKRFGNPPPYGVSPDDAERLRRFLRPNGWADLGLVHELAEMASRALPRLPFSMIRYADGSVYSICWRASRSSTGALMVDALLADGTHYMGSADTASRSSSASDPDVMPQVVIETADAFVCHRTSGPPTRDIAVPKPRGVRELWRFDFGEGESGLRLAAGGAPASPPAPEPPAAPPPDPRPPAARGPIPHRTIWLPEHEAVLLEIHTRDPVTVERIHADPDAGAFDRYLIRRAASGGTG